MSEGTIARKLEIPAFDGTDSKFSMWWTRFKAYAAVMGFLPAIKVGGESMMPVSEGKEIDETQEDGKKKAAAKKRNAIAVANLTMAFTTEATMCLVYETVSSEWPSGLAHKVVSELFKKYQPQDTMTKAELRQQLSRVTLKKNKEFEQLAAIKKRYNTSEKQIDEKELIATILEKAPNEYQSL